MRRKLFGAVLILLAGLALVGCGGGGGGHYIPPTATLVINNYTANTDIVYLYISPTGSASWGPDVLGNYVIAPGTTFIFEGIAADEYYDLRAETYGNVVLDEWFAVYFAPGGTVVWNFNDPARTVARTGDAPSTKKQIVDGGAKGDETEPLLDSVIETIE